MSNAKVFKLTGIACQSQLISCSSAEPDAWVLFSEHCEYVMHSDYARLKAEVERLTEDNRQLKKAFEIAEGIIKRMGNAAENAAKEGKQL